MLRHLPNALCVVRILLAAPVAILLWRGEYRWTLLVFGIAAITDGLDGFLAKRFHWTTELGKALDPLADKILLVTAFIMLTIIGMVPMWLAVPVVLRDLIITIGAIIYRGLYGPLTDAQPTVISKVNTLVQISFVLLIVTTSAFNVVWVTGVTVFATLVIVTTVASGIDYVATYIQRGLAINRAQRH